MIGTLYTSCYGRLKDGKGIKIAISSTIPAKIIKGVHYHFWMKALAPSPELLDSWKKKEITWDEYLETWKDEHNKSKEAIKEFNIIIWLLKQGYDVTIYCYESDPEYCHRKIISDNIEKRGFRVRHV